LQTPNFELAFVFGARKLSVAADELQQQTAAFFHISCSAGPRHALPAMRSTKSQLLDRRIVEKARCDGDARIKNKPASTTVFSYNLWTTSTINNTQLAFRPPYWRPHRCRSRSSNTVLPQLRSCTREGAGEFASAET
jgi:hypothetical protein